MGFRVPMIIASPWSRGGWVNSQLFDHTSTLMFLEHFVESKFGTAVREGHQRMAAGDRRRSYVGFSSVRSEGAGNGISRSGQVRREH